MAIVVPCPGEPTKAAVTPCQTKGRHMPRAMPKIRGYAIEYRPRGIRIFKTTLLLQFLLNLMVLGIFAFSLTRQTSAADWPQWGGDSHRNMASSETRLPAAFDP